jgi:hypothetical protein
MLVVIPGTPIEEPPAGRPVPDALATRLERALRRFRLQSAHNLLDEALATRSPAAFLDDVAWPVLHRLEADGEEAAVRFARTLFEQRLLGHARGWQAVRGPLVLLACAPRDEQVLGLIGLGIELAERGCRISYLGAATPAAALCDTAREQDAAAVVLAAEQADLTLREQAELRALAAERPLAVAGEAAGPVGSALGAIPLEPADAAVRVALLAHRESSLRCDEPSPTGPGT